MLLRRPVTKENQLLECLKFALIIWKFTFAEMLAIAEFNEEDVVSDAQFNLKYGNTSTASPATRARTRVVAGSWSRSRSGCSAKGAYGADSHST